MMSQFQTTTGLIHYAESDANVPVLSKAPVVSGAFGYRVKFNPL